MPNGNNLRNETVSLPKAAPHIMEISGLFLVTLIVAECLFYVGVGLVPEKYGPLLSIISHIPMVFIPWLWIHFRTPHHNIWRWPKASLKPLLLICAWLIPLQVLGNLDMVGGQEPGWYHNGTASIILVVLFQGVIVGFSEELLMRPAIHQTLLLKNLGGIRLFKGWTISKPILITAALFGVLHLGNLGQQPVVYTLFQVLYAFVIGLIIGFYYEKTKNYIGAAVLHNLIDVVGVLMTLIIFF